MTEPPRRAKLSAAERSFRSRIAQLAAAQLFLRGTLSERASKCGKSNCHCVSGELHKSLYLVQSQAGKLRQICVPLAWRDRVRQAVGDYQEMQRLIEEVSELEWIGRSHCFRHRPQTGAAYCHGDNRQGLPGFVLGAAGLTDAQRRNHG